MRLIPIVLLAALTAACDPRRPQSSAESATAETSAETSAGATPPTPAVASSPAAPAAPAETTRATPPASGAPVLSPDGIGPLRVGMTFAEADAALGAKLDVKDEYGNGLDACNYGSSTALPGVAVMVEGGRVARFDIRDSSIRSDRGVGEGDPATAVQAAYPDGLKREPHKYVEAPGHYLEWYNADRTRGIRYEIGQDGRVSNMYAGAVPNVGYVEGCS